MTDQTNELQVYICDTHTLVWYLVGDSKLSQPAKSSIKQAVRGEAQLVIPTVVVAELFMVAEKQRTALIMPTLQQIVRNWQTAINIHLTHLTPELILLSAQFTNIPDIFDRLIVTEAHNLNSPIITRDPIIAGNISTKTIW